MKRILIYLIFLLICSTMFASDLNRSLINANKFYEVGNFNQALLSMNRVDVEDQNNGDYALMMGKILLATHDYKNAYWWLSKYANVHYGQDVLAHPSLMKKVEEAAILQENYPIKVVINRVRGNINSNDSEFSPVLVNNGQTMIITSNKRSVFAKENIYVSHLLKNVWSEPIEAAELCTDKNETVGSVANDERTVYISGQYNKDDKIGSIYKSVFVNDQFTKPELISALSSDYHDLQPYIFNDEVMFLVSNRDGDHKNFDIFVSELKNGSWTKPINLGQTINTSADEQTPCLSPDGKTLYFSSTGYPSFGGYDVYQSQRIGDSWTEWTSPENMGPIVNSNKDDRYFFVQKDNDNAMLSSNRFDGLNLEDIYHIDLKIFRAKPAEVVVEKAKEIVIYGVVIDEMNNPVSTNTKWTNVINDNQNEIVVQSDADGKFKFTTTRTEEIKYMIDDPNYRPVTETVALKEAETQEVIIRVQSVPRTIEVYGKVVDTDNNPISTEIVWTYSLDNAKYEKPVTSSTEGNYTVQLPIISETAYKIEKKGYMNVNGNTSLPSGQKRVKMDFILTKLVKNKAYKIENIQFEFGKATLLPESNKRLDEIVDVMNSNPSMKIEISGHTDNVGSHAFNLKLSQDRAQAVVDYLVSKNISVDRLTAQGYSFDKPIADNNTQEGRDLNRRVEMNVKEID